MHPPDPSVTGDNPFLILLNSGLYILSNLLAALLVVTDGSMQFIQLIFTCSGIFISNFVLILINWNKIKKAFKR